MEDLVCFIGQKAFIEKNGELLILTEPRLDRAIIDLPGGKVQVGEENLIESLQREVQEETRLKIEVGKPFYTWFYTIPAESSHRSAGKRIFNVGYRCTYLSGEVQLSEEHNGFRWVNKSNYKELCESSHFFPMIATYLEAS